MLCLLPTLLKRRPLNDLPSRRSRSPPAQRVRSSASLPTNGTSAIPLLTPKPDRRLPTQPRPLRRRHLSCNSVPPTPIATAI